ncbi:fatty-acyl-CoA synthase [Actinokineospora alba]|uniref:Fatty-acyl-CoA synthase n=1 Tax=Actinokineospora alba TaxID=504798 RepID=A0A1H0FSK2_9PSEU|nr:acyl-CoA synthetase [Actinokineospora alba]TDP69598.1 fatty-acyl-CoA synthase [Actinokineospora alba]SDI13307.1 fatty-acyl-CoA synthase [Actinokineospora alba]SDN97615.1 fatty-acyl-CoA synthase [Actinokineospora alba]
MTVSTEDLLWPACADPADLTSIESVPMADRGLPETTYALLTRAAALWPDRTAITVLPEAARWREPVRRTYAELLADVHRYANLLHRLGVRRGDAVALMSPNCAELVPATLAAQLAGIAAPLNGSLSPQHLTELLARSGARILITAGPELAPSTWDTARRLPVDTLLVLRPTDAEDTPELPDGARFLDDLAAGEDPTEFAGKPPTSTDLAGLFHTGGTTGAPKLAAHTHTNEVADAWMLAANPLLDADSVLFAALPLFHVNALVVTLLSPLFNGQQVLWAGPLGYRDPGLIGTFWKIVEHYSVTAMSAVPTVYAVLTHLPVDADITGLRYAMVGASPLPEAVRDGFQAHTGVTLVEGYGLTEATCATARSFPDAPRPGAVGQRLPYQQVKAVRVHEDGTWQDLPAGEVGVLVISGPTVFPGYVTGRDDHGHTLDGLGTLTEGWLNTGDLARVDEDGFIHLAGRAKDLIIRGGHNIDPAMVEDAMLSHPAVTAASAVGKPDEHAGEVPVAYVTLRPGAAVTEDELCQWANDQVTERAAAPKAVWVLDALPVTDVGKPYKLALRADATRRALAEALNGASVDTVIEDGSITAMVTVAGEVDRHGAESVLSRYALRSTVRVRP